MGNEKQRNKNELPANPKSSPGIPSLCTLNFNSPLTKSSMYCTLPRTITQKVHKSEKYPSESLDSSKSQLEE